MKTVVQEEETGCGLACMAMLAGESYQSARQLSARGGELKCELAGDRVRFGGRAMPFLEAFHGPIRLEGERDCPAWCRTPE
ncbi:MAG: hypothetical protein ACOCUJ_03365 [Thiohalospira sp.]